MFAYSLKVASKLLDPIIFADHYAGPSLDLLCVRQSDAAPFVKIMQSFLLMQNT